MGRELLSLVWRVPVAAVGLVLNWIPYRLLFVLSRRQDLDKRSTWSIFGGLFLFPAFWLSVALIIGRLISGPYGAGAGWFAGVAVLIAAPLSGKVTLGVFAAVSKLVTKMAAWRRLRAAGSQSAALSAQRKQVCDDLSALRDAYRAETATSPETEQSKS